MKLMFTVPMLLVLTSAVAPPLQLSFPLQCGETDSKGRCTFPYSGSRTIGSINSVLDHSMKINPSGAYPYGKYSDRGGDGIVTLFDGERFTGSRKYSDETCIAAPKIALNILNSSGCGSGYISYDEHPGYDYRATAGMEVRAAAAGRIVNINGARCYVGNMGYSCTEWGGLGIEHQDGYITQYFHMKNITAKPAGSTVAAGETVGLTSNKAPMSLGSHLHFEVLKKIGSTYYYVDPYGWTGTGSDTLYSASAVAPRQLWR